MIDPRAYLLVFLSVLLPLAVAFIFMKWGV